MYWGSLFFLIGLIGLCIVTGCKKDNSNDGDIIGYHGLQDIWIAKINADRTITGQRTLGGSLTEILLGMSVAPDNGYLLAGFTGGSTDGDVTDVHGGADIWILKVWE